MKAFDDNDSLPLIIFGGIIVVVVVIGAVTIVQAILNFLSTETTVPFLDMPITTGTLIISIVGLGLLLGILLVLKKLVE